MICSRVVGRPVGKTNLDSTKSSDAEYATEAGGCSYAKWSKYMPAPCKITSAPPTAPPA